MRHIARAGTCIIALSVCGGVVKANPGANPGGGPPPVVVDSIEPVEIVQGQVPQPEIQVFGSDFIEGLPDETNRPTVTLRQPGKGGAEYSALAWVNFSGTEATLPADLINLLQAPLGVYDVIVTRPTDGASDTLEGAFTVTDGQPGPGEIALMVRSAWGGPVNDVEVVGNLAYAAIGRRLVILDVSDATNPVEVGSLNIMAGVEGVAVRDGYAFLGAHKPYRFCVADVSDPTNPVLVSAGTGDQFSHDVELYGDFAYVRGTNGQLIIFDITDPQNVLPPYNFLPNSHVAAISIVGDLLYVGLGTQGGPAGLEIYDLSDPLNPSLLGSLNNVGDITTALAVESDYAYWTVRHDGGWFSLEVVDVSIPESPMIVASETGFVWARDVAVSGGYAYVADATDSGNGTPSKWALAQGLVVFDIADPANPTVVSTFKTHGDVHGVQVVGDRAYLHDAGEGLIILDVSDPTKPVRLGNYHSPASMRQMDKVGDLLYVADAWNGFTVLDVSDATQPEVVSVYLAEHVNNRGVDARGIAYQENKIYLGAGYLGLEVVDVFDPTNPVLLGAFRILSSPCDYFAGVSLSGDVAHVGFRSGGCGAVGGVFLNLDVTEPTNIFELGRVPHGPNRAARIELNDSGMAFLGRGYSGFGSNNDLVIDTGIPASPIVIYDGFVPAVADVALAGNVLYLASDHLWGGDTQPGLYIQDVTEPANPTVFVHVGEDYPLGGGVVLEKAYAVGVATGDARVYVLGEGCSPALSSCAQAAYLIDAIDPASPVILDAVSYVGGRRSSALVDEPFFVATSEFTGTTDPAIGMVITEVVGLQDPADLDGDGSVGASDLLILLASWGPCPPKGDCPADLNDDGSVGAADLLILLANWG